jgi:hypothetical protein
MATVYSNSYLNIAATSARDCQEGLFKKDLGRCWKVGAPLEGKPVVILDERPSMHIAMF